MENWFVSKNMSSLASQEIINFGYDKSTTVNYKFNSLGFRSPEQHNSDSVIVIGNSISFGIGIDEGDIYGHRVAKQLGLGYINCSLGCYFHENHDHLLNLKNLAKRTANDLFLIQINNLDRLRISAEKVISPGNKIQAVDKFINYFTQVEQLLWDKQKFYFYWDNVDHELPAEIKHKFLIHNKFHIDTSLPDNADTFGIKSHSAISKVILANIT